MPLEPFERLFQQLAAEGTADVPLPSAGAAAFLLTGVWRTQPSVRLFVVTAEPDTADILRFDTEAFMGEAGRVAVMPFPAWDLLPTETEEPDSEVLSARLSFLSGFAGRGGIGVSSLAAFLQPVPPPRLVAESILSVQKGVGPGRERLLEWLAAGGYRREPAVTLPGEFAVRGGMVDVYPLHGDGGQPVRIEYIGDLPASIRVFEPESQRSVAQMEAVRLGGEPPRAEQFRASVLEHIEPSGAVLVLDDAAGLAAASAEAGYRYPGALLDYKTLVAGWQGRVLRLVRGRAGGEFGDASGYYGSIEKCAAFSGRLAIFVDHDAQAARLAGIFERHGRRREDVRFVSGFVSDGFVYTPGNLLVMSDAAVLNTRRLHRGITRPARGRRLVNLLELAPGDYVVHVTRGVARYLGIEKLRVRGRSEEFLALQFADAAKVYVPVAQFYLVQPYVGPTDTPPDLTRLGAGAWRRRKEAAQEEARRVAKQLLEIQAARRGAAGLAFPADDEMQQDFEAGFAYEETADQLAAAAEVKADMCSPRHMERLLCGDVGFGKTEIAMRAAFKAVYAGYQVLVLAPTTILSEQHYRTFCERFRGQPVRIELLSRFRSRRERQQVAAAANAGQVDVLIGTHSVLREGVQLRRAGLVIIDEEHRFGVRHKEALKQRYAQADVLLLSATPIPRTLHMALSGVLDISSLRTPPRERLAVRTAVVRKHPELLRRVVLRELARGGQVYYLHNRVETIEAEARMLEKAVPAARLLLLHGQMPAKHISAGMRRFLDRDYDVLVATTIIESGIDIPFVNTMLIDRPDELGLADLHQLRGRVGRYRYRAYCYLLLLPHVALLGKARRRLKAIEELQHLGAGFDIALRDMQIRGVGELLGLRQWGHARDVGIELYLDMLARAIKGLKGEKAAEPSEVTVRIFERAYIPEAYIPDGATRLDAYRQLARTDDEKTLVALAAEFGDRFGALPAEVEHLFTERRLALRMVQAGVLHLALEDGRLLMRLVDLSAKRLQRRWRSLKPDIRFLSDGGISVDIPGGQRADERASALLAALA